MVFPATASASFAPSAIRSAPGGCLFLQLHEGDARGFLLGLLLRGSGALRGDGGQIGRAGDDHFHQETLAVVRTGLRLHFVFGRRGAAGLQHLLQRGFVVAHALSALQALVEALHGGIDDGAAHEGARGIDSGIQIESRDDGFKAVGEQDGLACGRRCAPRRGRGAGSRPVCSDSATLPRCRRLTSAARRRVRSPSLRSGNDS